jgi:4-hydroxyphenylpyruvate dioxygenase
MTDVLERSANQPQEGVGTRARTLASFIVGWDHIEWWVGNARAFSAWLAGAFGFSIAAYAGPETGLADRVSYWLSQGDIDFVVTGALSPTSPIAAHVREHGDGVRALAFEVTDARSAFEFAVAHGASPVGEPVTDDVESGRLVRSTIAAYGETLHTFVDRSRYTDKFLPGFRADVGDPAGVAASGPRLELIDHCVGNVPKGRLEAWVSFYERMGFTRLVHFGDDQISTEYSALMSTVVSVSGSDANVVLPINEPADGRRPSQIDEYLAYYRGPGVQHIALATGDIVTAVRSLRRGGVRMLEVPDAYYAGVRQRLAHLQLDWEALQELGILVDEDCDGYLLQVFTENVTDRPTVFFEIIQRCGARGFGAGNFKALFEALERAQARRGNL